MKITYLKLKNYATIYTAMGLKEIEIDFSKSKNNVVLFVGDNGSGKTSILSTLHPFAYYGSMDIRSGTNVIRQDKDGYKEIHIQDNNNTYKIQHYYKNNKKGYLVKSFIQKNGEELNPNGNVTSFNDIVKNELSLELDFLRVLRLGSNVTNLIDMKAAERKSFTSDLLSDINVYTELFKKISDDNRILKSMIKTVSDKLIRLNILDKSVVETSIRECENKINTLTNRKSNLQQTLGSIEEQINLLVPEGIDNTKNKINELKYTLSDLKSVENKLIRAIDRLCIILTTDIDTEIDIATRSLSEKENQYTINENMILFYNEQLNPLYNKKEELNNQLKVSVSDTVFREMNNLYIDLMYKVEDYDKKYKDYTPIYTKDNLLNLLEVLKQIDSVVTETYGFGMDAVKKTVALIKDSINVDRYINKRYKEIDREILKISSELKMSVNTKSPIILFKPSECQFNECPYLYLYDLLFKTDDNSNKSIVSLESEKDLLDNMSSVNKNIDYIFMMLKTNNSLISKGNISYFSVDSILKSIEIGSNIYDEDHMTDLIAEVEEYDEYKDMKIKLKELKAELNLLKSNSTISEKLRSEIISIDTSISEILGKKIKVENDNEILSEDIDYTKQYIEQLELYRETESNINDNVNEQNMTQKSINELINSIDSVSNLLDNQRAVNNEIKSIDWELKKVNDELFELKVNLKEFISLTEEQAILNAKYDDISLIRECLSSTKGIPLLYMQLYLKNIKIFVNDLLKIVYKDNFEIDEFDINETEFNIPYIKNNIRISDVSYASQGEKSFLSLALSFALINQSIKDYNILLLDEIDSTLDIKNRAMFLNILEKQMESISAEQVFLITHNNMFENYPVDLILTSSNKVNNFSNANIIFSV